METAAAIVVGELAPAVGRNDAAPRAAGAPFAGVIVSVATILAIIGLAIALVFNPVWIGFAQDRAGVPDLTGYTPAQVREASASILADVIVGPPDFRVAVAGNPVLGPTERLHMADVYQVVRMFATVIVIAVVALLLALAGLATALAVTLLARRAADRAVA